MFNICINYVVSFSNFFLIDLKICEIECVMQNTFLVHHLLLMLFLCKCMFRVSFFDFHCLYLFISYSVIFSFERVATDILTHKKIVKEIFQVN